MRRDAEFFQERELELVYIAKKLKESLRLEEAFTEGAIEYAVEPDNYRGGVIFQSERVGAFFYVLPEALESAHEIMRRNGFQLNHS